MTGPDIGRILFIIPAFNEDQNIARVVRELHRICRDAEILVIDDGSEDETGRIAADAGAMVARLPFNLGIGVAVQTGLKYGWDNGYDWIIRLDGDAQHNPANIPDFIGYAAENEVDLIIGSRFLTSSGFRSSFTRRVAIQYFNRLLYLITGFRITDATSGFQAYSRNAVSKLHLFYPDDYPEPETIVMMHKWRMKVGEVSVSMNQRPQGSSSITAIRSAYYMVKVTMAILLDLIRY